MTGATGPSTDQPLLRLENVEKRFPVRSTALRLRQRQFVRAVNGVDLDIWPGETVGLVGETGCGKSTLARCASRMYEPDSGRITFDGRDITTLSRSELRPMRADIQLIFQDPYGALNPRRRVGSIMGDPLRIHHIGERDQHRRVVRETMEMVGLNPEHYNRFPAEFSGGQRQRIGIARALISRPRLVICDEPVSALDVSIQAQILNLLLDLQRDLGLTYLFIAHDLSVVRHVSDRVAVMYLGRVVETAPTEQLFAAPRHPYTAALLSAAHEPDPDRRRRGSRVLLPGDPPSPIAVPAGCAFHPRCPKAEPPCAAERPQLVSMPDDPDEHRHACRFPLLDGERLSMAPGAIDVAENAGERS